MIDEESNSLSGIGSQDSNLTSTQNSTEETAAAIDCKESRGDVAVVADKMETADNGVNGIKERRLEGFVVD